MHISESAKKSLSNRRVFKAIAFEGMNGRYETVGESHYQTLQWLFPSHIETNKPLAGSNVPKPSVAASGIAGLKVSPPIQEGPLLDRSAVEGATSDRLPGFPSNGVDEAKLFARDSLITWLSSGHGIYHISVKLGSGKSTLMRYLCEHKQTKSLLKEWAG